MALALAFAQAGESGEAEALARSMIGTERGHLRGVWQFTHCLALAGNLASSGHFDRAMRWVDEAMAVAEAEGGPAGSRSAGGVDVDGVHQDGCEIPVARSLAAPAVAAVLVPERQALSELLR
jgi:hypothetical protein